MGGQSNADEVLTVANITSLSESQASQFLKRYGSVQTAVNKFFDHGPELPPESTQWGGVVDTWDEAQFHTDKTEQYGPENRPQNSFQVHSQDTLNPTVFGNSLAPSRPPSRVSYTGSTAANKNLSDDEQMQQALSMSLDPAQHAQESGFTEPYGSSFGPAFRPAKQDYDYDNDNQQWGITLAGQQIFPNPEPEFRERGPGVPAFMKPTPEDHYLPALLTIFHAIPMAKEALLLRGCGLGDYGQSDEWWSGVPIEMPRVVSLDHTRTSWNDDILYESQRIMAFLELTDRAYGSIGALNSVANIPDQVDTPNSPEGKFLEYWKDGVEDRSPDFPLLNTFVNTCVNRNLASPIGRSDLAFVHVIRTEVKHKIGQPTTLYDVLDTALWGPCSLEEQDENYLEFADVLTFQLDAPEIKTSGTGSGVGNSINIKIPPVWYGDRYVKESINAAKQMRIGKATLDASIKKIEDTQSKLTQILDSRNQARSLEASQLLEVAKPFLEPRAGITSSDHESSGSDLDMDTANEDLRSFSKIADELQAVADRVTRKFRALEDLKNQALQNMRELSKLYTKPSEEDDLPLHHRFTLRGVAIDSTTTYVLANPNTVEDLIDTDQSEWQWWKLSYNSGEARPVDCSKVTELQVLHAAKTVSRKTLLVYTSDKAMSYPSQKLPGPLRNFVRADNLAFAKELDGFQMPATPTSKRKADDSREPRWGDSPDRARLSNSPTNNGFTSASQQNLPPAYNHQPTRPPPPIPPRTPVSSWNQHQPAWPDSEPLSIHIEDAEQPSGYQDIDLLGDDDVDQQEMQERTGKLGVVPGGTGPGVGEYALGSYVPEVRMQDVEDIEADEEVIPK